MELVLKDAQSALTVSETTFGRGFPQPTKWQSDRQGVVVADAKL